MKKFLTLVLALVLALGLSVPAMAFTSDDSEDVDHPYDLSIYLVEYDDNDLFGLVALPESDRGYAKNEIVAAVVELFVPKNESILPAEYATLAFGGDNVDLDVTDNDLTDLACTSNVDGTAGDPGVVAIAWDDPTDKDEIVLTITKLDGKETYKWLFFAKVTDDDASLYAELADGTGNIGFADVSGTETLTVYLDGDLYTITQNDMGTDDAYYLIVAGATDPIIKVFVDEDNKSVGMAIDPDGSGTLAERALGVNTDGELGIVVGAVIETGDDAEEYLDAYEDVVVDVFGMDYFLIGHYVRDSFFEDLVSADTITATVDIEPWTAYVTVPDNIVVDPPKTGDAASIMGFVMVALSGAGAVALKKRG